MKRISQMLSEDCSPVIKLSCGREVAQLTPRDLLTLQGALAEAIVLMRQRSCNAIADDYQRIYDNIKSHFQY